MSPRHHLPSWLCTLQSSPTHQYSVLVQAPKRSIMPHPWVSHQPQSSSAEQRCCQLSCQQTVDVPAGNILQKKSVLFLAGAAPSSPAEVPSSAASLSLSNGLSACSREAFWPDFATAAQGRIAVQQAVTFKSCPSQLAGYKYRVPSLANMLRMPTNTCGLQKHLSSYHAQSGCHASTLLEDTSCFMH